MDAARREKRSHGTIGFPFQIYPVSPQDSDFIPYHWHPETEIITIIEGQVGLTIAEKQYAGEVGDVFFVDPEQLHEIRGGPHGRFRAYVFPADSLEFLRRDLVQSELLGPLAERRLVFRTELRFEQPGNVPVREALRIIERAYAAKPAGYQLMVKAALLQIVAQAAASGLLVGRTDKVPDNYKSVILKKIVEYLNDHCTERLRLNDIAGHFGLSPQYFCAFFKDNLGKTFVQHVNFLRIERASRLLRETDQPIMEIAFSVGFENFSYFIKRFREVFGCTPSEYRKNMGRLTTK